MRKLDVSSILNGSIGMPVKAGTWQHIQNAYTELLAELVNDLYPAMVTTNVNVLRGVTYTTYRDAFGSLHYEVSAGSILYNNEIFLVPGYSNFYNTYLVAVLVPTQYSALDSGGNQTGDPVLFSNGQYYNIMDIRNIYICDHGDPMVTNPNNTLICNYTDLVFQSPALNSTDTWHSAVINPGWATGSTPLQYIKENVLLTGASGRVSFVGEITLSDVSPFETETFTTLPLGYRPTTTLHFVVYDNGQDTTFLITINPDGTMQVTPPGSPLPVIDLSMISFIAWQ